jgi:general secretion pathway protein G
MIRRHPRRAFTLIELLLVLVILAVLAAVVVPRLTGRVETARRGGTISDISNIKTALGIFETDNGSFPTTEEGLNALLAVPTGDMQGTWRGPYLEKFPTDKWGHEYIYVCPGIDDPTSYDLSSAGPNGIPGDEDDIMKNTEN